MAFYPDYSKHGLTKAANNYEFSYETRIQAKSKITSLSLPQYSQITAKNDAGTEITIRSAKKAR